VLNAEASSTSRGHAEQVVEERLRLGGRRAGQRRQAPVDVLAQLERHGRPGA